MTTQDILVLEWTFSPSNFFEASVAISRDDYDITIGDGKVEVKMEPGIFKSDPGIKDIIEDSLNDRFRGVQLLSHEKYELSYVGRSRLYPDGHKEIFIEMNEIIVFKEQADLVATKNGVVVYDSRKERTAQKAELAALAGKYGSIDRLAKSILSSYHTAVTDPNNELVHLYEIREALNKKFGSEEQTLSALGFSREKWKTLGRLANNEPIKQGRHRGKFIRVLRDATEAELKAAREVGRDLILAYLKFLEKNH